MADSQLNVRRRFLKGLAALPVIAAAPVSLAAMPSAPAETPILALFRRWRELGDAAAAHEATTDDEDAELNRLFYDEQFAVEDQMMKLPSTCAADFAAKVAAGMLWGGLILSDDHAVWNEARALLNGEAA